MVLPRRLSGVAAVGSGVIAVSVVALDWRVVLPRCLGVVAAGDASPVGGVAIASAVTGDANGAVGATGVTTLRRIFVGLARPLPLRLPVGT